MERIERCETSKRMLTNDLTVTGDSSSTRTYALAEGPTEGKNNSLRKASVATTGESENLAISHSSSIRSGTVVKRHLLRLNLGKLNSTTQKVHVGSLYVVVEVPQDPAITAAQIKDMRTQMVNLLTNANVDKLLNDEA